MSSWSSLPLELNPDIWWPWRWSMAKCICNTPIITTSNIDIPQSCESVTATNTDWSTCTVQSVDVDGKIVCKQTATITQTKGTHEWTCRKKITYTDWVVTSEEWEDVSCLEASLQPQCAVNHPPIPNPDPISHIFQLKIRQPSFHTRYANFSDKISFPLTLVGPTTEQNKWVHFPDATLKNISITPEVFADSVGKTGNAVDIPSEISGNNDIKNGQRLATISLKARAPIGTDAWEIAFDISGYRVVFPNLSYIFQKPFIGILEWTSRLWTKRKYTLTAQQKTPLSADDLNLYLRKSSIGFTVDEYFTLEDVNIGSQNNEKRDFTARINSSSATPSLSEIPVLSIAPFSIAYMLGGQKVSYLLSGQENYNDMTPIQNSGEDFLWVHILGSVQKSGNTHLAGENFSAMNTEQERNKIRQHAYTLIKNSKHNSVVNGVKYIQWEDITLPDNDTRSYHTLIVENGNVFIKNNISKRQKKNIGVLQKNYDVNTGFTGKGNILISQNVTEIHALLYADRALLSANPSKQVLSEDTLARSRVLQKQLHIYGSVFSRNTVGWALRKDDTYLLAWSKKTDNFDLAMIYDLNYLRRGNDGCDKNGNGNCIDSWEYPDATIIHYEKNTLFEKK